MDTRTLKGNYKGRAIDGGLGEASTGKEQVAILFELTEGEAKGSRLTYYGYFTDGTIESTMKGLRACGWAGTDLTELLDFKKSGLGTNEVDLVIEPEPVVDKGGVVGTEDDDTPMVRARIRWINALGRIGLKAPLAPDKAALFAQRMKGRLLAFDQTNKTKANGAPAATPPPAPVPAVDPGDIPF